MHTRSTREVALILTTMADTELLLAAARLYALSQSAVRA